MARGGYRKPTNPAPVSGPGSLSQRTDGGPADTQAAKYISGLPYGEGQEMMDIQNSAPLAAAPSIEQSNSPQGLASAAASQSIIPLNAPTSMPNVPVTDGAEAGPGGGMDALGLGNREAAMDDAYRAQIAAYMPALLSIAANPNTSNMTRMIIRKLRDQI
jgi:hypothetical protein